MTDLRAAREKPYRDMLATMAHTHPQAVAHCRICDDDGYRSGFVCDHIDYSEVSARGHALASKALADAKAERRNAEESNQCDG